MPELVPKVSVPCGKSGDWRTECFTISKEERVMLALRYGYRAPSPGTYTRLMHGKHVIMSDTDAERRDHFAPVLEAHGNVLITGLGLGMVAQACLLKPEVDHVFVVENSRDVIQLVAPHYHERFPDRFDVIYGDAFGYRPPRGLPIHTIWHDVWPNVCADNLPDMKYLSMRYRRKGAWQGCWGRHDIRR